MENINFDDLFAYRFQCQDTTNDEILIIRKLKYYLYDNNYLLEEIDDYIYQFYITLNYPISLDEIKLIEINVTHSVVPNINLYIPITIPLSDQDSIQNNITESSINNQESDINIPPFVSNIELLNIFINILNILNQNTVNEDIVVTTEDINNINKIDLDETIGYNCSICMGNLEKGDTILDIECKHKFHSECLTVYLEKYNHICPVCRKDIGKSKINY